MITYTEYRGLLYRCAAVARQLCGRCAGLAICVPAPCLHAASQQVGARPRPARSFSADPRHVRLHRSLGPSAPSLLPLARPEVSRQRVSTLSGPRRPVTAPRGILLDI